VLTRIALLLITTLVPVACATSTSTSPVAGTPSQSATPSASISAAPSLTEAEVRTAWLTGFCRASQNLGEALVAVRSAMDDARLMDAAALTRHHAAIVPHLDRTEEALAAMPEWSPGTSVKLGLKTVSALSGRRSTIGARARRNKIPPWLAAAPALRSRPRRCCLKRSAPRPRSSCLGSICPGVPRNSIRPVGSEGKRQSTRVAPHLGQ
jgi:hypothetical protein